MSVEKRAHQQLTRWIEHEKKLVNYREVAREFRLNINTAKRVLADHLTAHPSLFPTYLLTGQYQPAVFTYTDAPASSTSTNGDEMDVDEDGDEKPDESKAMMRKGNGYPLRDDLEVVRSGMVLVGGKEEMQAKLPLFNPTTLHVQLYSLSPSRIKDPAQYLLPLVRLRKYPNYCDPEMYGTTRGAFELVKVEGKGESSKSIPSAYIRPTASSSKIKPTTKQATTASASGSGSEKVKVKEEGKTKVKEEKEEPKSKYKKKVIASDDEEEEEPEAGPSSKPTTKSKQPLKKLDSVDADRIAMEAMMDMSDDFRPSSPVEEGDGVEGAAPSEPAESTTINKKKRNSEAAGHAESSADEGVTKPGAGDGGGGRVRKKRRTVKQVARTDAKGYMVFDDVSGEESYSSDGTEDIKPNVKKSAGGASKGKKLGASASASTTGSRAGSVEKDVKPNVKTGTGSSSSITAGKPSGGGKQAVKKPGQQSLSSFFKKK